MEILHNQNGNYIPRDWAWLRSVFGPGLKYLDAGSGEKFELVKIVVTEAEASLNAHVEQPDGSPCVSQPVGFSWPSLSQPADYLQDLSGGNLKTTWTSRAAIQYTPSSGQTGIGMSPDWYIHDMNFGGPGTVWVLSPSIPSDGLTGIGMIGGTVHMAPTHLYFQHVTAASGGGSGSGGGTVTPSTDLVQAIDRLNATLREAFRLG